MEDDNEAKIFCGTCPDSHCGKSLYFISEISADVRCSNCGQRHSTDSLVNVTETDSSGSAVRNLLKSMLFDYSPTRKGTELVKVKGLSNYHCKLVSPLLTSYGMDRNSGKAKLLSEMGQPDVFDCSVLGNRAFLIEKEHLEIDGYGRDKTGSLRYLKATLELIDKANDYEESLVPLHADGDGHCLVHAISKAVVGRELLWHSLRQNLRDHLEKDNVKYQALFCDFFDNDEWDDIIAEADPDFYPETNEPFGLRNMHVFGLANVLHRPIILLDSTEGMQSSGDYSGVFLPVLLPADKCQSQGVINKPLVIAWSSLARNHYVPLVGVKGLPLPKIPHFLLPKAWGVSNQLVEKYIEFDENGCCTIGGSRNLPERYVERLVSAMDDVFFGKHCVRPQLVADVKQFVSQSAHAVGISNSWAQVTEFTRQAVEEETLYRCLSCQAVQEADEKVSQSWRKPGGKLYTMAETSTNGLVSGAFYTFVEGLVCTYDASEDILKLVFVQGLVCDLCKGAVRQVCADGTVKYANGDPTLTKADTTKGCRCGFKHFWDGREYDHVPKRISVTLEWNGKNIEEEVFWFELESDPSLNSNAYEIASVVVQRHFPGEFGSEVLIKKVVDKILRETAVKQEEEAPRQAGNGHGNRELSSVSDLGSPPSKIILIGPKKTTIHKEELTKSNAERLTKARIQHHAAYSQKRKSAGESPKKTPGSAKLGKQEIPKAKGNAKQAHESKTNTTVVSEARAGNSALSSTRDRKIRLSSSDGKQATVTLTPGTTFDDLQEAVVAKLGIAKHRQKIRYGFPPRELKPPEIANEVLPLTHGDRVSVEQLPEKVDPVEQESRTENLPPLESVETAQELSSSLFESSSTSNEEFEGVDREQLAVNLLNLLRGAMNVDRWETLQHQPEEFERGGYVYEKVVSEIGTLPDDQHCSIADLPGKTFAYNAKKDRLELCLDHKHIPVQPLDSATLQGLARARTTGDKNPAVDHPSHDESEGLGAFSGVLRHRDAAQGRSAFSGKGRTLGESGRFGMEKESGVVHAQETKGKTSDGIAKMEVEYVPDTTAGDVEKTTKATTDGNINPNSIDNGGGEEEMVTDMIAEQSSKQTTWTDVEMKSRDTAKTELMTGDELRVAHEVSSIPHEMADNAHEKTCAAHEMTSVAHEVTGLIHVMADNAHEKTSDDHEMTTVTHEVTGDARGMTSDDHEMTSIAHEVTNSMHEVANVAREETGIAHGISSPVREACENDEHEASNDLKRLSTNSNSNVCGTDVRSIIDGNMGDKRHVGIDGDTLDNVHIEKMEKKAEEYDRGTKGITKGTLEATQDIRGSTGDDLQDEQIQEMKKQTKGLQG